MDCVPSGWSRKLSDDPDFLRWWGFSTAHWGGDVLVVESNGFDPRTWVDHFGYPHTDQMHLQERYQRTNYNTVELSMTITDPTKPESGGGVFALEIATGKKVWSTPAPKPACLGVTGCSAAHPGAPSAIPGVVFAGSLDGHLRAYHSTNGSIIWDIDTLHEFEAVNGIKARGGSMNGTGPTIAGGILYINSGYSRIPSIPGNVLLAFSTDNK